MAEGLAFGLAESLLNKVVSTAFQEIGLFYGLKDELKKLENTLTIINAVLVDAEEQQEKSHAVRIWIKRLEQVVYDADDLLDKFAYRDLRRKLDKRMARKVSDFFSSSNNQLVSPLIMGHAIKDIIGRLDEIAKDIRKFNFLSRTVIANVNTRFFGNRERETDSVVFASDVIGREKEKREMIGMLIGPDRNNSDRVPVTAIVGIGGLGKTTLAKLVFNDTRVVEHFEPRIWVCVSEDFDRKLIVKNILECITKESVEKLDLEPLQVRLRETLDGKKYLLVLDDVWNEENDKWIQLEQLLMVGANGSQIIVTTRSAKVASAMGIDCPYLLKGLSNELSWDLFEKLAFTEGLQKVHPKIIEIGKELINRCKGVPLAIRTLGSMMGSKTSESEWLSIQNSEIWSSSSNEGGILSVLKLSYDQLPTHLKHCFAYCSLFPKDYQFGYEVLIQLWMAQGYVQSLSDRYKTPEFIGGQYIKDLLSISFFQEVEVDEDGNITKFKMHDLIHDLAIEVAAQNCYYLTISGMEKGDYHETTRHISSECPLLIEKVPSRLLKSSIRTLFYRDDYSWKMGLSCQHAIMSNLTCLRVLDLHSCGIENLLSSIGKLKHLRYLDLSDNCELEALPNSISKLLNLQTLKLNRCRYIDYLPKDITKLVNLRNLMIDGCYSPTYMPSGIGNLTMLRSLPKFYVRNKTVGHSCYAGLGELKGLHDLRGKITIYDLEEAGADDGALEILKEKQHLQSLKLFWKSIPPLSPLIMNYSISNYEDAEEEHTITSAELVLESLEPHPNLKRLKIHEYCGGRFPNWMIKMVNVVKIALRSCQKCQLLQPLDQLPCLKFLFLDGLDSLEYIQEEEEEEEEEEEDYDNNKKQLRDGHPPPSSSSTSTRTSSRSLLLFFPSLQELQLKALYKLKGWWKRRRESVSEEEEEKYTSPSSSSSLVFPQLTKLIIRNCRMFTSMPLHPNLENLELFVVSEKLVRERLTTTTTSAAEEERKVDEYHHQMSSSSNISSECAKRKSTSREVQHLTALADLEIFCQELELSDDDDGIHWQALRSLRKLKISGIRKLVTLPVGIQHLTTLQHLQIGGAHEFLAVPDWIGNLTQLQQLQFSYCPKFSSLPQEIRCLTSLQQLKIYNCDNLASLPQEIRCLTSLQQLQIEGCPKLPERCQKETGEDWLNIAHIPNIKIDDDMIQGRYFQL